MKKRKKIGGVKDVKKKKTRGSREREVMNCGGRMEEEEEEEQGGRKQRKSSSEGGWEEKEA